jgi:manganese transport protein
MDLIAYPYWCVEKGYGRFAGPRDNSEAWRQRARGWIRVMGADIIASMVAYTIPTLAFYLLGAGILHTMGVVPAGSEMVGTLSNIYTQVLGDWSLYLFLVGAFAILYSTIFSGTMALGLVFADFLRVVGLFNRNNYRARRKAIRATMFVILFLSALFFSFLQDPVVMLKIGGFMYALMLPVVGFVTIYLSSKHTPKAVLPSGWITLALWLTAVLMAIMMGYSVIQQLNL